MSGKKRSSEEVGNGEYECVKKLRSRTIQIMRSQVGHQNVISSPGKDASDISKESVENSQNPEPSSSTIQSSSSKNPSTSCINVEDHSQHPLNILPREIWLLIVEKVEDSNDLESLSNSCLFFRDILRTERVHFLFQKVWKVLASKKEEDMTRFRNSGQRMGWTNNRIPSKNRNWLKLLLTLRLVCRSWSKSIDFYYQNHPLRFELQTIREAEDYEDDTDADQFIRSLIQDNFSMENEPRLQNFVRHFNGTHASVTSERTPFFGRSVYLGWGWQYDQDVRLTLGSIRNMLLEYGHQIWYCILRGINRRRVSVHYRRIRQVVELMPNLKALRLEFVDTYHVEEGMVQLQNEIKINPFPTLKNLELISTYYAHIPIFNEIIRNNSHVSTLDIIGNPNDYNIYSLSKHKLRNLSILGFSSEDNNFSNLQVKWSLENLCLPQTVLSGNFIDWQRVFNVLHCNWSETLTHLKISMPSPRTDEDKARIKRECGAFSLNLLHLTYLDLSMDTASCLDFLLPVKNSLSVLKLNVSERIDQATLREMRSNPKLIDVWNMNNVETGKVIKLLSCSQRPWEANMWTLFPKLKRVECCQTFANKFNYKEEFQSKWSRSRHEWEIELQDKTTKYLKE